METGDLALTSKEVKFHGIDVTSPEDPVAQRIEEFKRFVSRDSSRFIDFELWDHSHYPVTIVPARYQGTYEGGKWIAFPYDLQPDGDWEGDDVTTMEFWGQVRARRYPIGLGESPSEAYTSLISKVEIFLDQDKWENTTTTLVKDFAQSTWNNSDRVVLKYIAAVCDQYLSRFSKNDDNFFHLKPKLPEIWDEEEEFYGRWETKMIKLRDSALELEQSLGSGIDAAKNNEFCSRLEEALTLGLLWNR
jgi:hypothetical protein